jgi:hypothetical protein
MMNRRNAFAVVLAFAVLSVEQRHRMLERRIIRRQKESR